MVALNEQKMLRATGVISGENDTDLVAGVAANPYAEVGLVGYAYYDANQAAFRTVSVDGVSALGAERRSRGVQTHAAAVYLHDGQASSRASRRSACSLTII